MLGCTDPEHESDKHRAHPSQAILQAAAHGVPTVATKNGGPVDIMATLHHGLLVDPASSQDIANACFKLLTNSSMWDQMSHNGAP